MLPPPLASGHPSLSVDQGMLQGAHSRGRLSPAPQSPDVWLLSQSSPPPSSPRQLVSCWGPGLLPCPCG